MLPGTSNHYDNTNHDKVMNICRRLWKDNM